MIKPHQKVVFVVDDDQAIRDGLTLLLTAHEYEVSCFACAEEFLDRCKQTLPDQCMAILDLSMPNMNGLELQQELQIREVNIPVVFLSGEGDIPAAVKAVQHGAIDFVEKPVESDLLIDRIEKALLKKRQQKLQDTNNRLLRERLASLTPREKEVLDNLVKGKASKVIAFDLGISERTIELHRSKILKKMKVANSTQLLNQIIPYFNDQNK